MAGWGNKVEKCMDTVIPEVRITLNAWLLHKDIIILTFQVANNLLETDVGA